MGSRLAHVVLTVVVGLAAVPAAARAQRRDSAVVARPAAPPVAAPRVRDPFAPPITPRRAFLYSLLLPGLGQSKLQRPSAGAIYVAVEATGLAMLAKSRYDLAIAKRRVDEIRVVSYKAGADGRTEYGKNGPVVDDSLRSRYAQPTDDQLRSRLKARRLHYEDWVALIAFTHLFSGADAFVSAHLWDLPRQVEVRTLPSGATGVGVRVPFQPR